MKNATRRKKTLFLMHTFREGADRVNCDIKKKVVEIISGFDVCLSVHRSISVEKKTNWMLLNALLHL